MKCPHCLIAFHDSWQNVSFSDDRHCSWYLRYTTCPDCGRHVIALSSTSKPTVNAPSPKSTIRLVYPKGFGHAPVRSEVPSQFAADYSEACTVLTDSPKASAALSRRCLQHLLREKAGVKPSDLDSEISQIITQRILPASLADAVDAVRVVGNFAAHPIKSKSTGEIVDVEPGEADWLLDVLEGLFEHYFVQPEELKKKREALNKKLQDAGKPLLKAA